MGECSSSYFLMNAFPVFFGSSGTSMDPKGSEAAVQESEVMSELDMSL